MPTVDVGGGEEEEEEDDVDLEKLKVLLGWRRPEGVEGDAEDIRKNHLHNEYSMFTKLESHIQAPGWGLCCDAVISFLDTTDYEAACKQVCQWYDANKVEEDEGAHLAPPTKFLEDKDREHGTTYFSSRGRLIRLFEKNEPPDIFWQRVADTTYFLDEGEEDYDGVVKKWEEHYQKVTDNTMNWVVDYYKTWKPEKADLKMVCDLFSSEYCGVEGQSKLLSSLLRKYQPQLYLELFTFGQWMPQDAKQLRRAITEYLYQKDDDALSTISAMLAMPIPPKDILDNLIATHDPDYVEAWKRRGEAGTQLFPPWRCKDYPSPPEETGLPRFLPSGEELSRFDQPADPL
eukprot:Hpha_TRINITY_DN28436_c0_g1::TRINITY_DN28436_c0_g1_i1::g.183933::m.183933